MKIFKYIFVLAVAAMATACGDNDPSVVVKDYSVSGKVINVTYGTATVEINAPCPEGYTGGDGYWAEPFYTTLKKVGAGTEVYSSYDNRTDEVVGDRLVTTITYKGLEPGCEYQLLYEGGTLEAFNRYGYGDESSELPPIEVLTFKTPTMSSAGLLGAKVTRSYTEDNGAILILDFPFSVRISNYSYLYATKEDMSDAKEINLNSHYYFSELGDGSPVGVALGGFLKPNTTYYFQIKGDYMVNVDMGDGDELVSFTNAVCTPVKFRTSDKHTGLLGDAAVNTVYGEPSATLTDYVSSGLTVSFNHPYLELFDTPAYTTVVTEFVKGKTYYPLCTFDCYVGTSHNYNAYHVHGVSMPTPNTITF